MDPQGGGAEVPSESVQEAVMDVPDEKPKWSFAIPLLLVGCFVVGTKELKMVGSLGAGREICGVRPRWFAFYSRELFIADARIVFWTGELVKYAGKWTPVASVPAGSNSSVVWDTIAVGDNVSLFEVPIDMQLHRWSMSACSIVCFPRHYVHWNCMISERLETMSVSNSIFTDVEIHTPAKMIGKFNRVICPSSPWHMNYFHFMIDTIASLFAYPVEILNTSHIVVIVKRNFFFEAISWFDLGNRAIQISRGEYLWSENVYAYDRGVRECEPPVVLMRMRSFVIRMHGLDEVPASRYVFMNRAHGKSRHIWNMDDIRKAVEKRFKNVRWEVAADAWSIRECAILFNAFKLLFAPHGAGLANVVYMQPGGVLCEIQASRAHALYIDMRKSLGLHHVLSRFPEAPHYGKGMTVPVEIGVKMIEVAMKCLGRET
jgi:hypothetical protein